MVFTSKHNCMRMKGGEGRGGEACTAFIILPACNTIEPITMEIIWELLHCDTEKIRGQILITLIQKEKSLADQGFWQKLREAFIEYNLAQCGGQLTMFSSLMAAWVTNLWVLVSHPVAYWWEVSTACISTTPSRRLTVLVGKCAHFKHQHFWPTDKYAFPPIPG